MSTLRDRFKEFLDFKHLNSNRLSIILGYKSSERITRLVRSADNFPSYEILRDISNKFSDINIDYIITGNGTLTKSHNGQPGEEYYKELATILKQNLQLRDRIDESQRTIEKLKKELEKIKPPSD
jgi:hypothetical protein